jgi:hypothetical protein
MKKIKPIWELHSVIQENTDIDSFIPPNPGWNHISLSNHPQCKDTSSGYNGKWLIFVPNDAFIDVFREIAKMATKMELTGSLKASGSAENGREHVFCIYCPDYRKIAFVRKIAQTLKAYGFIERFGYRYSDKSKAIFFKTDNATHYKSRAAGEALTLFRFTENKELSVKEFDERRNPSWRLLVGNDSKVVKNFETHLHYLEINAYADSE